LTDGRRLQQSVTGRYRERLITSPLRPTLGIYAINNQLPGDSPRSPESEPADILRAGPLIEANTGDAIVVHVTIQRDIGQATRAPHVCVEMFR